MNLFSRQLAAFRATRQTQTGRFAALLGDLTWASRLGYRMDPTQAAPPARIGERCGGRGRMWQHRETIGGKHAMSIIRIGTTKKFADGWEAIFGGKRKASGAKPRVRVAKTRKKVVPRKKK
jgi:hypothetical protein